MKKTLLLLLLYLSVGQLRAQNAEKLIAIGDSLLLLENFVAARMSYEQAAKKGNANAMAKMGWAWGLDYSWRDHADDMSEAEEIRGWFDKAKAADQKNVLAIAGTVLLLADKAKGHISSAWHEEITGLENTVLGNYCLGEIYRKGIAVPQNDSMATSYFQKAQGLQAAEAALQYMQALATEKLALAAGRFRYELVLLEGDCFMMGCDSIRDGNCSEEEPLHRICLSDFMLGKYEVTQVQWEALMGNNPSYFGYRYCYNCPVEQVSWAMVQDFLVQLREKTGLQYRLPTESEWEYAARGGNQSQNYRYSGSNDPNNVAWSAANSDNRTHPVGQKNSNELGIYDLGGNVWEWCLDVNWDRYMPMPTHNPGEKVGVFEAQRVIRGGSWHHEPSILLLKSRSSRTVNEEGEAGIQGFRLTLSPN